MDETVAGPIRVVIVDDDNICRLGVKASIPREATDIEVIALLQDGSEAVGYLRDHEVDVVLMDVEMEPMDGIEAVRQIKALKPDQAIIMLTAFHNDVWLKDALAAGARGFATKTIQPRELQTAIHTVFEGRQYVEGRALDVLTNALVDLERKPDTADPEFEKLFTQLTDSERQVWELICFEALSNQQIATRLSLTPGTVKQYVSAIMQKMQVQSRTGILLQAARNGKIG